VRPLNFTVRFHEQRLLLGFIPLRRRFAWRVSVGYPRNIVAAAWVQAERLVGITIAAASHRGLVVFLLGWLWRRLDGERPRTLCVSRDLRARNLYRAVATSTCLSLNGCSPDICCGVSRRRFASSTDNSRYRRVSAKLMESNNRWSGLLIPSEVRRGRVRYCAPAAPVERHRPAPQLHR
jgi:hypothetical protein